MITYANPVYPDYFADPFVWRHEDRYYAIGTGAAEAVGEADRKASSESERSGRPSVFPVLWSDNLVAWHAAGRALVRLDPGFGDAYWAPEVAFHEGTFYLYYSVGHEDRGHQLRVATSTHPLGPYHDVGSPLLDPKEWPFAIDAHPFRDDNGQWYLFYARDFLDVTPYARAGTALVVRRLETMTQLAKEEHLVLRAGSDWQRFLRDRPMYGQVFDWHTLEGPCVRRHENRYYCFYSGGRWEDETYGVDYGVADHVLGPYSSAGGEDGPRVLRSVPGHVLGPGHNSITVGPDGSADYLIYHAWDPARIARRMFVDRLLWTPEGPRCAGPTIEPQTIDA